MRIVFIVLFSLLISACSSAPSKISYYLLDGAITNVVKQPKQTAGKQITLQKLQLAKYLQSASLPLLQQDHGVIYANHLVFNVCS